jgi:hypothetical protein
LNESVIPNDDEPLFNRAATVVVRFIDVLVSGNTISLLIFLINIEFLGSGSEKIVEVRFSPQPQQLPVIPWICYPSSSSIGELQEVIIHLYGMQTNHYGKFSALDSRFAMGFIRFK